MLERAIQYGCIKNLPVTKNPVGQKVTGEGKLPTVAGEKGYVKLRSIRTVYTKRIN